MDVAKGSKVDGRGVSPTFAHIDDRIGVTTKTAPAGGGTPDKGLTDTPIEEVMTAMTDRSNDDRRRIAGEFLTRARDDFERAARTRISHVLSARRYGMTNADIGALIGISESAVRALVKRHGGE